MSRLRITAALLGLLISDYAAATGDPGVVYVLGVNVLLYILAPIFLLKLRFRAIAAVMLFAAYAALSYVTWTWAWKSNGSSYLSIGLGLASVPALTIGFALLVRRRASERGQS